MLTRVVSAWLATPSAPSGTVPIRPTIAESASSSSGSATSAPNAGTASRRMSRSTSLRPGQAQPLRRDQRRAVAGPGRRHGGPGRPGRRHAEAPGRSAALSPPGLSMAAGRLVSLLSNVCVTGYYHFDSNETRREDVTGQVNFTSHMDAVVTVAVRLANALTPGEAHGRPYLPPGGRALPAAVTAALREGRPDTRDVSAGEAARFRTVAAEIRAVFDAVAAGRADTAASLVNGMLDRTGARPQPGPARRRAVAPALPRSRGLAGHRLGRRVRHRAGRGARQRPARPARGLHRAAVRPGLRRHLAQRDPPLLLDLLPEPGQDRGVPPQAGRRCSPDEPPAQAVSRRRSRPRRSVPAAPA